MTFVPGNVAPSFDGYYAGSYTSVVTAAPKESNYDASKSFVYYKGHKAKFSVGNGKYVAITMECAVCYAYRNLTHTI